jgi:exodeoxyribonuclease V beta subunit
VVTFTDAATKELRERIRTRLAEAARFSVMKHRHPMG